VNEPFSWAGPLTIKGLTCTETLEFLTDFT
jgi:hypothetical protein